MPAAPHLPAYASVRVDDAGNVWVKEYALLSPDANRWSVFDMDGSFLGTLELPVRFAPYHIGEAFVLGVWIDELDVEQVQVYELIKPQ